MKRFITILLASMFLFSSCFSIRIVTIEDEAPIGNYETQPCGFEL